jgi:quercetin dioxygenase-like cupin family protein
VLIRRSGGSILLAVATLACHYPAAGAASNAASPVSESDRSVAVYRVSQTAGGIAEVRLVEVRYGPGASSKSHRHSCPVVGYVVSGAIRSQVDAEPETVYKAGESFYEPAGALHAVSANASNETDARLLAVFLCPQAQTSSSQP